MARDSAERPPKLLTGDTLTLLRATLARYVDDERTASDELRAVLQRVAREAVGREIRAEELVVMFKAVLDSLPPGSTAMEKMRRARLRDALVTQCIRAYYGAD